MKTNLDLNPRANLKDLVARLEDHGVEVPGLDRWHELNILARVQPPAPALPENLLEQTEEQMEEWAQKYAQHYVLMNSQQQRRNSPYGYAQERILDQLDGALMLQIRTHADSIIEALRPAFDEAADMLRHARSLGVKDTDTIESLFHHSDEKRNAWTAAKAHADTLDEIFETRQVLSWVADVPPTLAFEGAGKPYLTREQGLPSGINWTITIVKPELAYAVTLDPINHDAPWQRWLKIADHLELALPKAEDPNDPEHFRRRTGMTFQQAQAQADGLSKLSKDETALVSGTTAGR